MRKTNPNPSQKFLSAYKNSIIVDWHNGEQSVYSGNLVVHNKPTKTLKVDGKLIANWDETKGEWITTEHHDSILRKTITTEPKSQINKKRDRDDEQEKKSNPEKQSSFKKIKSNQELYKVDESNIKLFTNTSGDVFLTPAIYKEVYGELKTENSNDSSSHERNYTHSKDEDRDNDESNDKQFSFSK